MTIADLVNTIFDIRAVWDSWFSKYYIRYQSCMAIAGLVNTLYDIRAVWQKLVK